ncbi:ABC transporter ATP-binding protein [Micropruina sp.]|uniref:ABC transporter ATP-binding protein n=1 Tax=Micropruina sp. TaxID=2737536 RepID=UPI0039E28087
MSEHSHPEPSPLALRGVQAGYGERTVLHGIDLAVVAHGVTSVIGPNGCGKSTMVRTMGRLLRPTAGDVLVDERPIRTLSTRDVARRIAVLPQSPLAPEGLTVADLAARGRQPHQPWYRQWSIGDERIVADALRLTRLTDLADRPLEELSGGQRQRAWLAMVLAQQTPVILLDEPTTHLDLAHAVEVLDLVHQLAAEQGKTVLVVLHDLGLAARYSDRLVVMKQGRIVTQGSPAEVLDDRLLAEVFGLAAHVFPDPVDGLPTVVPARKPTSSAPRDPAGGAVELGVAPVRS